MTVDVELPPLTAETAEMYVPLWLDGALDAATAASVAAFIEESQDLADLAEALSASGTALKSAFEHVLTAPLPLDLARTASKRPPSQTEQPSNRAVPHDSAPEPIPMRSRKVGIWGWGLIAACCALMAIGGPVLYQQGVATGQQTAQGPGWIEQVATYHAVYGSEGRHLVEVGADEKDHLRAWLGQRTGYDGAIPDLSHHGLTFAGGRMLVTNDGRPVAQLMYTQANGRPVGLCFVKSAGAPSAATFRAFGGIGVVSWNTGGHGFVVVGWEDETTLGEIAGSLL